MPALTRTARGLGRTSPAEARVIAALTGLGAELALTVPAAMPTHASMALRAKLMTSAADPAFMSAASHPGVSNGPRHGGSHTATNRVAGAKSSAVAAKISSAIAPFVAPVAAGVIATNLAVAGAFVANHQSSRPVVFTPGVAAQAVAPQTQAEVRAALAGQLALLNALGHTYDLFGPAQLTSWLQSWSNQTTSLLTQLTSRTDLHRYVSLAQAEVTRLSAVLPSHDLTGVTRSLSAAGRAAPHPAPGQLPGQLPTPASTLPSVGSPTPLPTSLPTSIPTPTPVSTPTATAPGVPVPSLGPVTFRPL